MPFNHNSVFRKKKTGPCCDFDKLSLNDMVTLLIVNTLTVNFSNSFKVSWHSFSQIEGYYKYQHID